MAWLQEAHHWPGLSAVDKVTAIQRQDGAESEQINYIVRGHWGIENRLHWELDVTRN